MAIDHYRNFPLGTSTHGLVVFETYMLRDDIGDTWTGVTNLAIYGSTFKLLKSISLDSIQVRDTTFELKSKYIEALNKSFSKALVIAQGMSGFIAATPIYLSICEYQQTCGIVSLKADTLLSKFYLLYQPTRARLDLTFLNDTTSKHYEYLAGKGSVYETTFNRLAKELSINSIRKYKIGTKTLLVTHIGESVQMPYTDYNEMIGRKRKEYIPKLNFSEINQSIFYEPELLHHTKGVDLFVWVD